MTANQTAGKRMTIPHPAVAAPSVNAAPDRAVAAPPRDAVPDKAPPTPLRLGLRANLAQFMLLVTVNALVGGTLGQERTVLPLLATQAFHLAALTSPGPPPGRVST